MLNLSTKKNASNARFAANNRPGRPPDTEHRTVRPGRPPDPAAAIPFPMAIPPQPIRGPRRRPASLSRNRPTRRTTRRALRRRRRLSRGRERRPRYPPMVPTRTRRTAELSAPDPVGQRRAARPARRPADLRHDAELDRMRRPARLATPPDPLTGQRTAAAAALPPAPTAGRPAARPLINRPLTALPIAKFP